MSIAIKDAWNAAGPPRKPQGQPPQALQPQGLQPLPITTSVPISYQQQPQFEQPPPQLSELETMMQYQQELGRTQMEQVVNYIGTVIGNMETYISKKIDTFGRQVLSDNKGAIDDQNSKLNRVLSMTYIIIGLVVVFSLVLIGAVMFAQGRVTRLMLEEFRAVCRNVIKSSTLEVG